MTSSRSIDPRGFAGDFFAVRIHRAPARDDEALTVSENIFDFDDACRAVRKRLGTVRGNRPPVAGKGECAGLGVGQTFKRNGL